MATGSITVEFAYEDETTEFGLEVTRNRWGVAVELTGDEGPGGYPLATVTGPVRNVLQFVFDYAAEDTDLAESMVLEVADSIEA